MARRRRKLKTVFRVRELLPPEHYLPLLYVMGATVPGELVTFPAEGIDGGSVSMLAVLFSDARL